MKRIPMFLFFATVFCYWAGPYSGVALLSAYAQTMQASLSYIGIIVGSYGLMQFLFRFPLGIFCDYTGNRKAFILFGTVCSALSPIILFFADTPVWLLIGRSVAGLSACAYVPIAVLCADFFPADRVSRSTSTLQAVSAAAQMAAMLLGGYVADLFGVRWAFLCGALFGFASILLCLTLPNDKKQNKTKVPVQQLLRTTLSTISYPNLIAAARIAILLQSLSYGKVFNYVPLIADRIHAAPWQLGIITTIASFFSFLGSLSLSAFLLKYIKERIILIAGFSIYLISCIMVPLLPLNIWMLLVSQALSGIAEGLVFSLLMANGLRGIQPEKRATSMGFYQAVYAFGMFCGPWLVGILGDQVSMNAGFYFLGVLALLGLISSCIFIGRKKTI